MGEWEEVAEATGATEASMRLQARQKQLAASFSRRAGIVSEGTSEEEMGEAPVADETPLIVTFEDMARGLHFDGVEVSCCSSHSQRTGA